MKKAADVRSAAFLLKINFVFRLLVNSKADRKYVEKLLPNSIRFSEAKRFRVPNSNRRIRPDF